MFPIQGRYVTVPQSDKLNFPQTFIGLIFAARMAGGVPMVCFLALQHYRISG